MRETTVVPTNLLTSTKVEDLGPIQKLVLLSLWSAPWLNAYGYGEMPRKAFAITLGVKTEELMESVEKLEGLDMIAFDAETAELFMMDWYRFHSMKKQHIIAAFEKNVQKIRSLRIKNTLIKKSEGYVPRTTTTSNNRTPSDLDKPEYSQAQIESFKKKSRERSREREAQIGSIFCLLDEKESRIQTLEKKVENTAPAGGDRSKTHKK